MAYQHQENVAMELHKAISNNQLVFIQNAAHYPHIENPAKCSDTIAKFLLEHAC